MQTQSSDENFVFLSVVGQTRDLWQNERKLCLRSIPHERPFTLVLWQEEWLMGTGERPLLSEILGKPAPVGAKSPILNWYSLVAPQP